MLFLDIETSPMLAEVWGAYKTNVLDIVEDWYVLCYAYAEDDGKVEVVVPSNVELWGGWNGEKTRVHRESGEAEILEHLWRLLDDAEIVVAHNGDRFDIRKINARFIKHGFPPPSPYLTIDTLKSARKYFNFPRNRLGDLGIFLGLGGKDETGGYSLWRGCMAGDVKSWKKLAKYNKRDIDLLRDVYKTLRPWVQNHPHVGGEGCPKCGSMDRQRRGLRRMKSGINYRQFQCTNCGGYYREVQAAEAAAYRP